MKQIISAFIHVKHIMITIAIIFAMFVIYNIYNYANAEPVILNAESETLRIQRAIFFNNALIYGSVILFFAIIFGTFFWLWSLHKHKMMLAHGPHETMIKQKNSDGSVTYFKPDASIAAGVKVNKDGTIQEFIDPKIGIDNQVMQAARNERTKMASSLTGELKLNAQGAKFLAGGHDIAKRQKEDKEIEEEPVEPFDVMTLDVAWNKSNDVSWIMGQSDITGELCILDMSDSPHIGIAGTSGSGKTKALGYLLLAYAISFSYKIIILDGKGSNDYKVFNPYAEYHILKEDNFETFIKQINAESERRNKIMNDNNIYDVKSTKRSDLRPIMVFVDEFGSACEKYKLAYPKQAKDLMTQIGNIFRLARSTNIHMVIVDQTPATWPAPIANNVAARFLFYLPGYGGNTIKAYNLDKLEKKFHYQFEGNNYKVWKTYGAIEKLLGDEAVRVDNLLFEDVVVEPIDTATIPLVKTTQQVTPPPRQSFVTAKLTNQPETPEQIKYVKDIYLKNNKNMTATCIEVYGSKNQKHWDWIKNTIETQN